MNHTILNFFDEHPYKAQLDYHKIKQYDLARSIGISQSSLSKMLNGIEPMEERIEIEIQAILNHVKNSNKPERKTIIRGK